MTKHNIEMLREQIRLVLAKCTPREHKILDMRFGLTDGVLHTLREVSKVFKLTPERIRQIEAKALSKSISEESKGSH